MTVVVPAPEEPVTAMTGCLIDMRGSPSGQMGSYARASGRNSERSLNSGELYGRSAPLAHSA